MITMSKALIVAVTLPVLAGGCRAMTGQSLGQLVDNKLTTAKVKSKLTADALRNLTWVDVDTSGGVVYLTGNTSSAEAKARATEIAMQTRGVRHVYNDLQVNGRMTAADMRSGAAARNARGTAAPAASPAATARAGVPSMTGEVVQLDQGTGSVTLRMADGNTAELRLPPGSLQNVSMGDRLSIMVSPPAR